MASVSAVGGGRRTSVFRWVVLAAMGVFFLLPLVAMFDFSTRGGAEGRDLAAWRGIGDDPALLRAILTSLELAVLTALLMLVLLVPTMTWVHLRVPRAKRLVEALCLLPLVIPAIVLVVGIADLYSWVTYFLGDSRDLSAWRAIGSDEALLDAIVASVELAVLTALLMLVLLVPTMTWVHLRLPRLKRVIEALCILPLVIPAIVLVVGIASLYTWVTYFFGDSPLTLTFVYVVLVLPYAYRAVESGLTAVDLKTLSEAARSLGASWGTVLLRVVLPNIRAAVLSAALLSVALVLGEFTIASLLNFTTLQVNIALLGKANAALSIAVALAALLFAFALLLGLSLVADRRRRTKVVEPLAVTG